MEQRFATRAYRVFLVWGIFSALGTAVSTFVDAVLVGNFIGSDGLAAVNIATPVFLILAFLGITIAVGANVLIGRMLGQSDIEEANILFRTQIAAGLAVSILCVVLGTVFSEEILYLLGATEEIIELAKSYTTVVFVCGGLFIFYHILSFSVRSDGDPKIAGTASFVLIILNILLDFLFLGVIKMGIMGASLSLCIATFCAILVLVVHFFKKNALLRFGFAVLKPAALGNFIKNGFGTGSAFLFQAVIMGVFNQLLISSGADGTFHVAFFGIVYTMSTFAYAVFDGASTALTPVVSIFSGEKDVPSIFCVFWLAFRTVVIAGLAGTVLYLIGAPAIIRFFGISDAGQIETAVWGFRVFSISMVFTGINMLVTSLWQSISRSKLAGLMSILRNLVCMLFAGILLIPAYQTVGLGEAYICCEVICTVVAAAVLLFDSSKKRLAKEYSTVNRTYEKVYLINTDSISQVSADFERISEEWEIGMKDAFFINFVVEEIILNIIKFAVNDKEHDYHIAVRLIENQGSYILRIRDDVADYNPFETNGDEVDNAVIKVIKGKAKDYNYQRKLIFNYLYLVI